MFNFLWILDGIKRLIENYKIKKALIKYFEMKLKNNKYNNDQISFIFIISNITQIAML